jgi:3-oxoacyl-[acyl-carrier protein] reductase
MPDRHDRVALVTGASRGIGRGIAIRLAGDGHRVVVNYHQREDAAREVVAEIEAAGGAAVAIQADVSQVADVERLIAQTKEAFGPVQVLVNNAGIERTNFFVRMSEEEWDAVLDTNLKSMYLCCHAVLREMIKAHWGRIVNLSSVVGRTGSPYGQANYAAAKAGVIGLSRCLAHEVGSRTITVNVVAPGLVPTEINNRMPAELTEQLVALTPLRRKGTVEEIAAAVAFLVSDEAAFITGQTLGVDGGFVTG